MPDAKPFASLTAGLLARKGHARPAMRPGGAQLDGGHDDLGWNDLNGGGHPVTTVLPPAAPLPEVVHQQAEIAREFAPEPATVVTFVETPTETEAADGTTEHASALAPAVIPVSRARGLATGKAKAAFTLRLDADRHLRLRLACAVSRRSAQQIVTQALDAFLAQRPDIDALTESVSAPGAGSRK